ncbi:unnamed protein product [Cyclocybe aegerita]|uniref:Uncharacterized protein n=1 Tax=Cyclocybe aegerita TaxID=1973307 RepID=A0A8S0W186_CYCAE|nr:unnamed protein product [Cyclocybe aegerita]
MENITYERSIFSRPLDHGYRHTTLPPAVLLKPAWRARNAIPETRRRRKHVTLVDENFRWLPQGDEGMNGPRINARIGNSAKGVAAYPSGAVHRNAHAERSITGHHNRQIKRPGAEARPAGQRSSYDYMGHMPPPYRRIAPNAPHAMPSPPWVYSFGDVRVPYPVPLLGDIMVHKVLHNRELIWDV